MTRFMLNCEVEADLSLAEGDSVLRYAHPYGRYIVFLRNLLVAPGSEPPLLSVQMEFEAPSLQEAKPAANEYLREFLDFLTLVTTFKFRLHRVLQIFDWERSERTERSAIYFTTVANNDIPIAALKAELLETLSEMQQQSIDPRVRRAIKWFANGVASMYPDDQFTFFWLAIEVLAQVTKETALAPDKCPTCRGPMYCATCGTTPLHRPYAKQAIEQLFQRHLDAEWEELYKPASAVRNQLMHGEEIAAIEASLEIELSAIVDDIGRLALTALISQFPTVFNGDREILLRDTFANTKLSSGAYFGVSFTPNFDAPDPAQFPQINFSITLVEAPRPSSPDGQS